MDNDHSKRKFGCNTRKTGGISVGVALCIWVVVFIILLIILRAIHIRWFSNIVFSALVAAFVLCFIFPLRFSHGKYIHKSEDAIFGLIIVITWILVIIYIIWKVFTDYDDNQGGSSWWGSSDSSMNKAKSSKMGNSMESNVPPAGPF
uniref:Transmembrane protein n=1 Tax=Pithovirus LCPAC201 TaxID=2506591 RepID=A0A481Z4D2_9VIRU|nr:MAG: uncharacterized protein LCPAC201_00250 [Pithovirus LCPAC201]